MCFHAEFGRSTSKGVNINKEEPKSWRTLGLRPLWYGKRSGLTQKKHVPLPMCYLVERDHSVLNGIGINKKNPQNWGTPGLHPLGTGHSVPAKQTPPHVCYQVKFGRVL